MAPIAAVFWKAHRLGLTSSAPRRLLSENMFLFCSDPISSGIRRTGFSRTGFMDVRVCINHFHSL